MQDAPNEEKQRFSVKEHLVDTTSALTQANPLFAALEVGAYGLSSAASLKARAGVGLTSYAGLNLLFAQGRDVSQKVFGINKNTSETTHLVHDTAYIAAMNAVITPPLYSIAAHLSGETIDPETLLLATVTNAVVGGVNGPLIGYAFDIGRDLMGIKECDRKFYPEAIKRQSPGVKKAIFAGAVATSCALVGGIYAAAPNGAPLETIVEHSTSIEQSAPEPPVELYFAEN